jgi:hypothetical protein
MAVASAEGEAVMNRKHERAGLIDLGAASVETKGATQGNDDHVGGLIRKEGLSND